MDPLLPFDDDPQERNLRRIGWTTLVVLAIVGMFVCWWLYEGVGYFKDEMSFNFAYGPRKAPRIPLPAGTVPRDGMGYDNADFGLPPMAVKYSPALGAKFYHDQCGFCHAAGGRGDAPAGLEYTPRPPDLNRLVPQRTDAQLFTAISDGMTSPEVATSPPLGPRWHEFRLYLSEAQRRQLVDYLRQHFGQGRPEPPPATTIAEPAFHIVGNPPASKGGTEQGAFPPRPLIHVGPPRRVPHGPHRLLPSGPVKRPKSKTKKPGKPAGGRGTATSFWSRPPLGRAVAGRRSPATDARWRSEHLQVAASGGHP
ncbi:MAG: c-type cytochrome [Terriglobales bacterium]